MSIHIKSTFIFINLATLLVKCNFFLYVKYVSEIDIFHNTLSYPRARSAIRETGQGKMEIDNIWSLVRSK